MRPVSTVNVLRANLAVIVVWAIWAAYFNTAQFGDNVEQFNWAQSLELGYHKHPPLPSWLLCAVVKCLGPSIYWAYLLAALCLLGTVTFTWFIARDLVGERVAAASVLLWGLNMTFSQRVQLYNHNTVLVLCFSATVWSAMRAIRVERTASIAWLATGLMAAAAFLSKYQAAVPLAGLVLTLAWTGKLRRPENRRGLALAAVVMLAVCAPHVAWVIGHKFSTLHYAFEAVEEAADPFARIGFVVSFVANQVRLWSPALLAMLVCLGLNRRSPREAPMALASAELRRWHFGLVWFGLIVLLVMALAMGVSLRNHWGVQSLQFFSIWAAWQWDRRSPIPLARLLWTALAIHACSLAMYAFEHRDPTAVLDSRRIDTMYPARRLAQTATAHWSEVTDCPLRYVAGTVFDAGLVSLYTGGQVQVFDSESATPWVKPHDLQKFGALYVLAADEPFPADVADVMTFDLTPGRDDHAVHGTVKLGVLRPAQTCD